AKNPARHEQDTAHNHGLTPAIDAPAARDEMTGKPAAGERSDVGGQVRNPCKHSDLCEAEPARVVQILREPCDVEPPRRIGDETREHDPPDLAVMEEGGERRTPLTRRFAQSSPRGAGWGA